VTHSDRETEYTLQGYMYRDIHSEMYELVHPLVQQLFNFTPKNHSEIKLWTCIVIVVATKK